MPEDNERESAAPVLLRWSYSGAGPNLVDESLTIYGTGMVRLSLFAGAGADRMDRCGTFAYRASAAAAEEARGVAALVATARQVVEPVPRGAIPLALAAGSVRHQVNVRSAEPREPSIDRALTLAERLREEALASPVSAIRLALRLGAPSADGSCSLMFEMSSIGSAPVRFAFAPNGFSALGHTESGESFSWRGDEGETMGLLDNESLALIGGTIGQATLVPGQRGTATFLDALSVDDPGSYEVVGTVDGQITIDRPELGSDLPLPRRFRVRSAPVSWGVS